MYNAANALRTKHVKWIKMLQNGYLITLGIITIFPIILVRIPRFLLEQTKQNSQPVLLDRDYCFYLRAFRIWNHKIDSRTFFYSFMLIFIWLDITSFSSSLSIVIINNYVRFVLEVFYCFSLFFSIFQQQNNLQLALAFEKQQLQTSVWQASSSSPDFISNFQCPAATIKIN